VQPFLSARPCGDGHRRGRLRVSIHASTTGSNGRVLSYDIVNKPEWATFVEATGVLSRNPGWHQCRTSGEIEIGVSDGQHARHGRPFRIRGDSAGTAARIRVAPDPARRTYDHRERRHRASSQANPIASRGRHQSHSCGSELFDRQPSHLGDIQYCNRVALRNAHHAGTQVRSPIS